MLELLNKVKDSGPYKEWNHPEAYLCSIFITDQQTQLSFYDKKTKLVTSFKIEGEKVTLVGKDEKIFQKEKHDLQELNLNELAVDFNKAKEISNTFLEKKYPHNTVNKEIIILQVINNKIVWNFTKITSTFNIINIKLDAYSGEIIEDSITAALSFKGGLAKQ